MPEDKGFGSTLVETGGRLSEAALQSGLPQIIAGKNPVTLLAEQATGLVGGGALGLVSINAVGGMVYGNTQSSKNNEEENQQALFYGYNFRG